MSRSAEPTPLPIVVPLQVRLMTAGALSAVGTYTAIGTRSFVRGSKLVKLTSPQAPLERTKILLQVQGMRGSSKYHGVWGTMRTVVREEGVRALWKGNGANITRVVPNVSLKFTFNDYINELMLRPGQSRRTMSFGQLLGAGTLAGLWQMSITYPIETVRTRLTLSRDLAHFKFRGITHCFVETVRLEGFTALYKGFGVSLLSGAPYVGIQMSVYSWLQHRVPPSEHGTLNVLAKLACGATAGVVAQSLMYPGDTLRRRMQTSGIGGEAKTYTSTWHCARIMVANEGVRGLYRGVWANTVKAVPNAGIQFLLFDLFRSLLVGGSEGGKSD